MLNEEQLQVVSDQIQMLLLFLERPVVQAQVFALLLIIGSAWLIAGIYRRYLNKRLLQWGRVKLNEQGQRHWVNALLLFRHIAFPVAAILLAWLTINYFQWHGWLAQQMLVLPIFWVMLIYGIFIALMYIILDAEIFTIYHRRIIFPLVALSLFGWITSNLINFHLLANVQLIQLFSSPVTLGSLVMAVIGLYFLVNLAWAGQDTLQSVIVPRTSLDPGALNAVLTIGRYIVVAIGVLIVLGALGFDATTLAVIGGGLSVGIGFGLQSIVSNFISGIVLLFEQSLRPGDVVKIDNTLGEVKKLSIRATTVRTYDNVDITVPNETLFTTAVTNYTQSSRVVRIVMMIGVSYNSDPKQVMSLMLDSAREHGLVLDDPEPCVFFNQFGDSSLMFRMHVWVADPNYLLSVPSDLRMMIWKRFNEHNIKIPFPQRDLHIRSGLVAPEAELPVKQVPASWENDPT
jgi:small-conductance mechanosensitive channel